MLTLATTQKVEDLFNNEYRKTFAELSGIDPEKLLLHINPGSMGMMLGVYVERGPYKDKRYICYGYLSAMPGCCGVVVSNTANVPHPYNNRGIGKLSHKFRLEVARIAGYGTVICTDVAANTPELKILETFNWKKLHTFTNPRTKHVVNIHVRDIEDAIKS